MGRVPRVSVVGSFIMDLVIRAPRRPEPGETLIGREFGMFPGGKGANQAVAAARLGAKVNMIGRLGKDSFGETFLGIMAEEGIDCSHVAVDEDLGTGVGNPVVEDTGENSIIIVPQANSRLSVRDIEKSAEAISEADALLLQLEVPLETSIAAAQIAGDAGVRVILNPAPARELPESFLQMVSVIVPNEVEFQALTGVFPHDLETTAAASWSLIKKGPHTVVVTLGSRGAYVVENDNAVHVPAERVSNVMDTTAAGDAFCGALAHGLASGKSVIDAVCYANKAASIAITRMGAIPSLPRASEVK